MATTATKSSGTGSLIMTLAFDAGPKPFVGRTRILTPAIRVMDQARRRVACGQRHLERSRGQLGAHVISHGPADDLAAVRVEDDRQVQPVPRADVGDVAEPLPVWCTGSEIAPYQVVELNLRIRNVVRRNCRGGRPANPAARIRRAIRLRDTGWSACSSAWIRGAP